jgi:two-component system, NtrC family, sensor kinase
MHPHGLQSERERHAALASPAPDGALQAKRRYRVLVVDDNAAIHDDFRKVLCATDKTAALEATEAALLGVEVAPRTGTRVEFTIDDALQGADGVECVRRSLAESRPYAVAFVDMRMPPGQDGLKTILDCWSLDPQLQVVICSAYSDYSWREISAATGETDQLVILRKPFDPEEVLQLAHALSRKWEVQRALQRQLNNLEGLVAMRTREVSERQALFQLILENAADLIAVVDGQGRRLYNSPSYEKVLGFTPAELQASDAFAHIHPEDLAAVRVARENAKRNGRGEPVVYRMQHRDGSWRVLESCAGVVRGIDGGVAFLVIVARDITQRHELEFKQQLGQKLESIGRLAAGIAHEINTPTQYITDNTHFLGDAFRMMTQVLQEYRSCRSRLTTPGGEVSGPGEVAAAKTAAEFDYYVQEIPHAIEQSLDGLSRISKIVGSLKEFSHPNPPDKAPVDLNRAIEVAVGVTRHEWKYVAEVVTELDPALPAVPCLLDEINQVMLNLIVNAAHTIADALKARGETLGRITIRTRIDQEAALIEVADTGMGIASALRGRIFEPFFTTKGVGKGTGQGLAIVHAIVVNHHGGNVDFSSEVGRGTTFRVWLPLKPIVVAGISEPGGFPPENSAPAV